MFPEPEFFESITVALGMTFLVLSVSVMAEYFESPPQIEFAAGGVGYEVIGSLEAITNQANS